MCCFGFTLERFVQKILWSRFEFGRAYLGETVRSTRGDQVQHFADVLTDLVQSTLSGIGCSYEMAPSTYQQEDH